MNAAQGSLQVVIPAAGVRVRRSALMWGGLAVAVVMTRLTALGDLPLSPAEATWALESRSLHLGELHNYHAGPVLTNIMSFWFGLFSMGDGQARTPAALAGAVLCFTPWLFRSWIGTWGALLASVLLVLSPVELLAARSADPASLVALWIALVAASTLRTFSDRDERWLLAAGAALGAGLGTGQEFAGGLVATLAAIALCPPEEFKVKRVVLKPWIQRALIAVAVTALLLDTRLLSRPAGLQAGLVDPWALWLSTLTINRQALAPIGLGLAHEPVLLVLAAIGAITAARSEGRLTGSGQAFGRFLVAWVLVGLLVGVLSSTGALATLATTIVPLSLLAGSAIKRLDWLDPSAKAAVSLTAVCLMVPICLAVLALNLSARNDSFSSTPLIAALGGATIVLLVASTWLGLGELKSAFGNAVLLALALLQFGFLTRLNFAGYERGGPLLGSTVLRPDVRIVEALARDWWRQDPYSAVEVDSALRPYVEWSLRDGPPVRWISSSPQIPARAVLGSQLAGARGDGRWVRVDIADRFRRVSELPGPVTWWRWLLQRQPLVRAESDAILFQR